jgi:hypothetical protein
MRGESQLLNARSVRWIDAGVAVWVVVWIVLGVLLWHDIGAQAQLSDDVIKIGAAVESTGEALGVVGGLPLVGERIGEFADRIQTMGAEVEASGQDSRSGIERTAVIAGLGLGVLPAALVLLLYLPARLRWKRYTGAIAAALPGAVNDPAFDEYLARRAADALPWGQLRAITPDPWGDIGRGECRALADAELERLGLRRP